MPLFDNQPHWKTESRYLSTSTIEKSILGLITAGFYLTTAPNVLGVDIDDHKSLGDAFLLSVYEQVCERLRCLPSLLVKSPRGLHAFWFLTERLPWAVLEECANERLQGIPVDIRPSPYQALRIPVESRLLDPGNLQLLNLPIEAVLPSARAIHTSAIFGTDYLPDEIRESLQGKKGRWKMIQALPRIEKIEADLLPFHDGMSNDVYCELVAFYKRAGLDEEQAYYRFVVCLVQSPGYSGSLRNPTELRRRIASSYRNLQWKPRQTPAQTDLFHLQIAQNIADLSPFAVQRRKPIEQFILQILEYKSYHDEIRSDPVQVTKYTYFYPYYRQFAKAGLYPLPSTFLKATNSQYQTLMPWLRDIEFLREGTFEKVHTDGVVLYVAYFSGKSTYSNRDHVCKYYQVNDERFMS